MVYFDIEKQKVVWIIKCRENDKEAARNALSQETQRNLIVTNLVIGF